MKITSHSHLLSSLGGLVDPTRRDSQQQLLDRQQLQDRQQQSREQQVRETERQEQIQENREALSRFQEDLRRRNLEKLQQTLPARDTALPGDVAGGPDLNLRERVGGPVGQPRFERLGQIIDIKV